jgi:hypothetical protein
MLVSSYWHKTVLFWHGVQGKLQKGCLETTVRYDSMCKKGIWQGEKIIYTLAGGILDFEALDFSLPSL